MDIDNKKGLRFHVAPCFIWWRPCNWWGGIEFVGDFYFLREGEGAKRVAMMLIWKSFL